MSNRGSAAVHCVSCQAHGQKAMPAGTVSHLQRLRPPECARVFLGIDGQHQPREVRPPVRVCLRRAALIDGGGGCYLFLSSCVHLMCILPFRRCAGIGSCQGCAQIVCATTAPAAPAAKARTKQMRASIAQADSQSNGLQTRPPPSHHQPSVHEQCGWSRRLGRRWLASKSRKMAKTWKSEDTWPVLALRPWQP